MERKTHGDHPILLESLECVDVRTRQCTGPGDMRAEALAHAVCSYSCEIRRGGIPPISSGLWSLVVIQCSTHTHTKKLFRVHRPKVVLRIERTCVTAMQRRIYASLNSAFQLFLEKANILHEFPDLPFKLRHGFLLGNFKPLVHTYTPDNLPGAYKYHTVITEYIKTELNIGCLSGPFSRSQLEAKISPFRSSPLQVAVKKDIDGAPDKYRVCRHLSYQGEMGYSVNNEINVKDYPTDWGTADEFTGIVGHFSPFPIPVTSEYLRIVEMETSTFLSTHA